MGPYTQQGPGRVEYREVGIPHLSGQMEQRSGHTPASRPQHTGLPRPSMRDPSPNTRSVQDIKSKGMAPSSFGFGRSVGKAVAPGPTPELRGKSSRNVLRRKPSSVAWQQAGGSKPVERSGSSSPSKWLQPSAERRPSIESSLKSAEAYNEIFTRPSAKSSARELPRIIPELDRYRTRPEQSTGRGQTYMTDVPRLATQDLPPPTPLSSSTSGHSAHSALSAMSSNPHRYSGYSGSGYSASPSTRFSESPGPGAYSRDTTPTSMSSQSPGIVAPFKTTTPRLRQGSPALSRPPVTRRRAGSTTNEDEGAAVDTHGLPALRESITSSSSNSTVKGEAKSKEKKKKKRLSPLPPSPPPRKSSQKFKKPHSEEQQSPSKASQVPAIPVMASPSESSPSKARNPLQPLSKTGPPTRPSREGTPNLQSQIMDPTVIQSNLAGLSFPQDRRRSALPHITSPLQSQVPKLQGSKVSSRGPSPSPVQQSHREATPTPSGLGIIPDLKPKEAQQSSRAIATRTPSPGVASTKSRFGLFGRRTKTAPADVLTVESKEKTLRKGPAAGTGHEGYGKYGLRGRSSSAGGLGRGRDRSMSGASSPQDSIASTRAHDPFLLERMSPVIIAGGGEIIENRNASSELTRSESSTSLLLGRPSMDSKGSSKTSLSHDTSSRATLWPSALPRENANRASTLAIPKGRRPSDSSDDGMDKPSSLAIRRSMQRLNNSNSSSGTLHLPKPITIPGMGMSPSLQSVGSSLLSEDSQLEVRSETDRGRKGQLTKPKKLEKRAKSPRKWNFFHRSHPKSDSQVEVALPVTIGRPPVKAVPHYAMLDSSDEQAEADDMNLEDILRDADVIQLSDGELDALQFGDYKENMRRIEEVNTMMKTPIPDPIPERPPMIFSSPEPLPATPELPKAEVHIVREIATSQPMDLHLTDQKAPSRPSRLPQVGRIPKVVSARPVATSPKSFSRPFARLSTIQPLLDQGVLDTESIALGPSPPKPSTPELEAQPETERQGLSLRQESNGSTESTAASHRDFLAFSQRKNSEGTTSSSGGMSFAGTTAVIPEADAALEVDEVWDEYDDLITNETIKVPLSATSSVGVPFQYESYETRRLRKSKQVNELAVTPTIQQPSSPTRRSALTASSAYSADMTARMKDAFALVPTPTTPMSFADFFSGYGDRNNSSQGDSAKKPRRPSLDNVRKSNSSSHTRTGSGLVTIAEQDTSSATSQVNLRVGSMTVSKWLTFGHVLFSPARDAIMSSEGSTKRHSILVIDGLGNGKSCIHSIWLELIRADDWSFYAAETYPSATFYNLSPTRPLSASQRLSSSQSFPLTPANHRQVQYLSPTHKIPFPSSTFHVVVFRFPPAMPESSYRNLLAESKRVLKPAGYLEMAVLDLDMLNMGNRARRAVRGLKMKIQAADPHIALGSASDSALRILGKRGFTDVKTCNVGVPVASTVASLAAAEERSLADMMRDTSSVGDEGITKMVARVGRWWYSRCYETSVLNGDAAGSIFNDAALLRECEEWNSSFKLVVAYAQKPVQGRRRTASV